MRHDRVWQGAEVTRGYLEGVRGAIPLAHQQMDVMLRVIHKARQEVVSFLDLGCGDGVLARAVLESYPDAKGVLFDFSEPMLDVAREKMSDNPNLIFIQGDYSTPDWVNVLQAHAPFEVIVSGYSIHHQPDEIKRRLYQEIYELLAPGGVFLNMEHVSPEDDWVEGLFDDMMIDSMFAYHQHTGGTDSHATFADKHHHREDKHANILAPVDAQCNWLREIGFVHVDCYFKVFELALFGGIKEKSGR
ncbi:MAG: class I SAM-dependent methyltransferase [Aggregatilineales bacterium]